MKDNTSDAAASPLTETVEPYWGKRPIQHTPGPWHWDSDPMKDDPYNRVRYRVVTIGKTITQVYYSSGDPKAEADTRLIAVAPELLEACQLYRMFVEVMNDGPDDSDRAMAEGFLVRAHQISKAAIARAEGPASGEKAGVTQAAEGSTPPPPSDIREALEAFLAKFDLCEPAINDAFAFRQNHGLTYRGPTYEKELADLRAALTSSPPGDGKLREALQEIDAMLDRMIDSRLEMQREVRTQHRAGEIDSLEHALGMFRLRYSAALSVRDAGERE